MIVGFATETIVASTRIMKNPNIMAHSAFHGFPVPSCGRSAPTRLGSRPAMRAFSDEGMTSRW